MWIDGGLAQRVPLSPLSSVFDRGERDQGQGGGPTQAPVEWPVAGRARLERVEGGSASQTHIPLLQRQSHHTTPRVRAVNFVLLDRFQESWPVRSVAVGARSLFEDDLNVLMELADSLSAPSAWPKDTDENLPLHVQHAALEATLESASVEALHWARACRVVQLLADEAAAHGKEHVLSDRAVLRQWVRSLHLDDAATFLKHFDAHRIQSLAKLREEALDSRVLVRAVKLLYQPPAVEAATLARLQEAVASLNADYARFDAKTSASGLRWRECNGHASGLKWRKCGDTQPTSGRSLINAKLANALARKVAFTQQEWDAFGIRDLRIDHFVMANDSYFKPVDASAPHNGQLLANSKLAEALARKTEFGEEEWDGFGIKDLRMAHVVKSGNSYFAPAVSKSGAAVVQAMGEADNSLVESWFSSWRDAEVALYARLQRAFEELSDPCLEGVRRRLVMLSAGVEKMAIAAAESSRTSGPSQRMGEVLTAVCKGQEKILTKVCKLTKADAALRARCVDYVRNVAAAGTCVVAMSCDDLPLAAGMRVRLRPGQHTWARAATDAMLGVLERPVYSGSGLSATLSGWLVKIEDDGQGARMKRDDELERREVPLDALPSQPGVKVWAHLPLQEFVATANHHQKKSKQGKVSQEDKNAPADLAIKRLLDYSIDHTFVIRKAGYTDGWLLAERVARQIQSTEESASLGNVQEKDLEMLPHSPEASREWRVTHCIEFLQEVKAVNFVGEDDMFLAVTTANMLHLFARSELGALKSSQSKGLLETHSRTRPQLSGILESRSMYAATLRVDGLLESKSIFRLSLRDSMWQDLEHIPMRLDLSTAVTAVEASCRAPSSARPLVAVGSSAAGLAKVVDISKWQAAVKARHVLESWLQAVVDRRWSDIVLCLVLEEVSGVEDAPLLIDVKDLLARKERALQERTDAKDGDDTDDIDERISDLGERIKMHADAKKDMVALGVEAIKDREPYAKVSKSRVRRLLGRVLTKHLLERTIATCGAGDEPRAAEATNQLELLQMSQVSDVISRHCGRMHVDAVGGGQPLLHSRVSSLPHRFTADATCW